MSGPFATALHTAEEAVTTPHASFPTSVGGAAQPIMSPATVTPAKRSCHTNTLPTNLRALQPQCPHQQQLQKPAQWPSTEEYIPPTPLQPDKLWHLLRHHPQQHRVNYVLKGLTDGFSLEYTGPISFWAPKNLPSAAQFPDLVLQHLNKEIAAGRMLGPFQQPPMPDLMCFPIVMVPKRDSIEMRMIMHLSYPYSYSINDFIDEDKASTHYQQFDDAIKLVVKQGRFCWLAKGDVKSAFKLAPIKYDDLVCFGIYFDGQYYMDLMLPFGSAISCAIFEDISSLFHWLFEQISRVQFIHYLDDYLMGHHQLQQCTHAFFTMQAMSNEIGLPLSPEKLVPPTQC